VVYGHRQTQKKTATIKFSKIESYKAANKAARSFFLREVATAAARGAAPGVK
jgi:hypothetical protein